MLTRSQIGKWLKIIVSYVLPVITFVLALYLWWVANQYEQWSKKVNDAFVNHFAAHEAAGWPEETGPGNGPGVWP